MPGQNIKGCLYPNLKLRCRFPAAGRGTWPTPPARFREPVAAGHLAVSLRRGVIPSGPADVPLSLARTARRLAWLAWDG